MRLNIVLLPGDGIGPDVIREAAKVLAAVATRFGHTLHTETLPIGGNAIEKTGLPLPPQTLAKCVDAGAVLLGAVGGPQWADRGDGNTPEAGLLGLRKGLGVYANLRPARLFPELAHLSSLKTERIANGFDLLIVRELIGGLYFGEPRGESRQDGLRKAFNTMVYDEREIRRIASHAFHLARKRRKKLCSVDKANVLEVSRLWRNVVCETAADFPDVTLTHLYVDNAAMQIIRVPQEFDVIVTENLFGDILSDEAAMLTGSIGLLPSASLGEGCVGLYEPIHGSAPDIAGQDVANPIATILSAALMLRYSFGLEEEALCIEDAVEATLRAGFRTRDIWAVGCEQVGTHRMGELICNRLGKFSQQRRQTP